MIDDNDIDRLLVFNQGHSEFSRFQIISALRMTNTIKALLSPAPVLSNKLPVSSTLSLPPNPLMVYLTTINEQGNKATLRF